MLSSAGNGPGIDRALTGLRDLILAVDHYRQLLAERDGLTLSQMSALGHLRSGDMGPSTLAQALDLTTGSTTTLLDRLEEGGWAHRMPHPHDRRRTMIQLTEEGGAFIDRVREQLRLCMAAIDPDHLETVTQALTGIAASLRRAS